MDFFSYCGSPWGSSFTFLKYCAFFMLTGPYIGNLLWNFFLKFVCGSCSRNSLSLDPVTLTLNPCIERVGLSLETVVKVKVIRQLLL